MDHANSRGKVFFDVGELNYTEYILLPLMAVPSYLGILRKWVQLDFKISSAKRWYYFLSYCSILLYTAQNSIIVLA